jgi:transcriptional regulator with XRE-family HTH domain
LNTYGVSMNTSKAAGASRADELIAHQIRNALIVQGTNQKELAAKTGISFSTIRRSLDQKRDDRRSLTIQELTKIAEAIEVPTAALLPASMTQADAA